MNESAFVKYLCGLSERDDRAALAQLRRGLGKPPGTVAAMHRYVVPWLPKNAPGHAQDSHYLIASLYALHPRHSPDMRSLGQSLRRLAAGEGGDSTERRFTALLNAHADALPDHLRHAVALARSSDVPINYSELLEATQYWTADKRPIQRRWARDFWQSVANNQEENTTKEGEPSHDH